MPLLEEGWHYAKICGYTLHRDGNITVYFCIDGEKVKGKFNQQNILTLFKLLGLSQPKEIKRSTLTPLMNKQVAVKLKTFEYEYMSGRTIMYSKVVSVRREIPEDYKQSFHEQEFNFRELYPKTWGLIPYDYPWELETSQSY